MFVNLCLCVIERTERRGKMRRIAFYCTALLLILSAIAEGQSVVEINPIYTGSMDTVVVKMITNEKWIAIGDGAAILVYNRLQPDQRQVLWLDDGTDWGQGTENMIIHGDTLIVGGRGPWIHKNGVLGVWDLANPLKKIKRPPYPTYNPEGLYVPQNWTVKEYGLKYAFLNAKRDLIGIYNDETGSVSVYELFGEAGAPIQEFLVGENVTSLAFDKDEDFFAIGNDETIRLFKFKPELNLYEEMATYRWEGATPDRGYPFKFVEQDGLGLTVVSDKIYLVVHTNCYAIEVIEIALSNLKITRRSVVDGEKAETGSLKSIDGEFAILGDKLLHIPSGSVIGEFQEHLGFDVREACLLDHGSRIGLVTAESPYSIAQGAISVYDEPVFTVSLPKKIVAGTLRALTTTDTSASYAKVLKGGAVSFVVTADPGKKVHTIKKVGKSKQVIKKDKGSLIYRIKNIESDTGLEKVQFRNASMPKYDVYTPYLCVIGYPTQEGDPRRWWTTLTPGEYVAVFESTNPGGILPYFVEIRVKPQGGVKKISPSKF